MARFGTLARSANDFAKTTARTLLLGLLKKACRLNRLFTEIRTASTSGGDGEEPVYDILNCGPRHRFCTPWAVAHNCLGLGFGLGHVKFQSYAKVVAGVELTLTEAKQAVDDYRKNNPRIVALWKQCDSILRASASERTDKTATVELPSGRVIRYFNCSKTPEGIVSRKELGGPMRNTYGGLVVENLTQATAREFMSLAILRIEAAGYPVLLHVHDEIVASAPDADLQDHVKRIESLMLEAPAWAAGLPVGVESAVSKRYEK